MTEDSTPATSDEQRRPRRHRDPGEGATALVAVDMLNTYVQDNYGDWNTSAEKLADQAMRGRHPELVEPILPPDDVAFLVKARHSA